MNHPNYPASTQPDTTPLSMTEKIGYGVGDMASNFYMGVINVFLLYYYTDVWGIDPGSAAFMFLITKVIDAVSDPCMGLIADRTKSRWGRYRPYLLWGALPTGLLGYLLFLGPDLSTTGKLIFAADQYMLTLALYSVGIFAFGIIITLLFAMYTDCAEYGEWKSGKNSAGLTVSASMFSLKAGSAIGSAVPAAILAIYGFKKAHPVFLQWDGQTPETIEGIQLMFNVVPALFFFVAGLLMIGYTINNKMLKQIEEDLASRRVLKID